MYRQPNPRIRSLADLNKRDREHFEVARLLGQHFTRAEFLSRYAKLYPRRTAGSIIPSDYCFNRENKGNKLHPRFLIWEGRSTYSFAGLKGEHVGSPPPSDQASSLSRSVPNSADFSQSIESQRTILNRPRPPDLAQLWANIQALLDARLSDWRERIDDLGQVDAVRERRAGKRWSDVEAFKAHLAAVLSAVTDWSKVAPLLSSPQMQTRFEGYDYYRFSVLSDAEIERIVKWLQEHGAGSQNRRSSLRKLRESAGRLSAWSTMHGSVESYFCAAIGHAQDDPKLAAVELGRIGGRWKLAGLGTALASEVLRNLGFDLAKPDRHVNRAFGAFGLVRFRTWKTLSGTQAPEATDEEKLDVMMAAENLANTAKELVCFVDNSVWLLCAKSGLHLSNEELAHLALKR